MDTSDKIKVFLVDDDIMFVESLKHSLSAKRIDIRSFSNGEDCIKNLHESPHIVVLDYVLNNTMNGVQVLNQIKQSNPDTEVIILSAIDNMNIMKDTIKYGAYDFIEKGESAIFTVKKEIKDLCDEIESSKEINKEDNKVLWINAGIILVIVAIFVITHIK